MFVDTLYETTPETGAEDAASTRVIVLPVIVPGFICSLNVTVMPVLTETLDDPVDGAIDVTIGGVRSGAASVVNEEMNCDASPFPTASCAAVVTTMEYPELNESGDDGVSVAVLVPGL